MTATRPDAARGMAMADEHDEAKRRSANLRTALILLSVAAAFFAGIIVKRMLMG